MEVKLNLDYRQVLDIIRQLPYNQIEILKNELTKTSKLIKKTSKISDFKQFILSGPVMSDGQYQDFIKQREHFYLWRTL